MDFDWTAQEHDLRTRVAGLFDGDAAADMEAMEQAAPDALKERTAAYLASLSGMGYLSLGQGPDARNDTMRLMAAQEELAAASGSLFLAVETTARLFGGLLAAGTNAPLAQELLGKVRSGSLIGALAVTDAPVEPPGSGETPPTARTLAVQPQDAGYVLNGEKPFVTNAPIADWIAVVGALDGKPAAFLLRPDTPNLTVAPRLRTLGYNGLTVSAVRLAGVRAEASHALCFESDDVSAVLRTSQDRILTIASLGVLKRALFAANKHARAHLRGGAPIFRFQEVRFKLAEMVTLYQTAQLLTYRAAWLYSVSDPDGEAVLHSAKVFAAEAAEAVSSMAMQIQAGPGYVWGSPAERAYREAKYAGLAGTTTEKARMAIAETLLARYR